MTILLTSFPDWATIATAILGSSAISTAVAALFNRRKTKAETDGEIADNYEKYAARLEKRIENLEERQNILDTRDSIFTSAVSCAYRCEQHNNCPVLEYLSKHSLPSRNRPI